LSSKPKLRREFIDFHWQRIHTDGLKFFGIDVMNMPKDELVAAMAYLLGQELGPHPITMEVKAHTVTRPLLRSKRKRK
jgi:hypothetical protein